MTGSPVDENGPQNPQLRPETFEREVLIELICLHLEVLRRMPLVQVLLVFGIVFLVFQYHDLPILLGWSLLAVIVECIRAIYAYVIKHLGAIHKYPFIIHKRLILLAALVGITVGLSAILFMAAIPITDQALLSIILFAMPAAGVSVAVSSRSILAAYSLGILVPTAFSWIALYPYQTYPVVGLTFLYWLFIISVAADGYQLLRRSVAIRRERDQAVFDLEKRNALERMAATKSEGLAQSRARVLATASHDLRQPLHALSVYSAVLASNPVPETLPEVAKNIDRLVRTLGSLLHGLLDLSRLSPEYYVPERQRISLDKLVEGICNEYQGLAQEKSNSLIQNLGHVRLFDDPFAISRIIRNLLDNAVKYTDQGEIRVFTIIKNGAASLIIEDTGKGIALVEQNRIFEEFYQLDNPERDHYTKGVGLGLAIVEKLCNLIDATIKLESRPGFGSRFTVTFNSIFSDAFQQSKTGSPTPQQLQGKRIYVVDDEIDILDGMRVLLSAWEVDVKTANSTESTDALFKNYGIPDLLIVDLRLRGEEKGTELAFRLEKIYGTFPVLIVSGEITTESLIRAQESGCQLLKKPITSEVLYKAACNALGINN